MEQIQKMKAVVNGISVEGTPDQIAQILKGFSTKRQTTKKTSINGAPLSVANDIVVSVSEDGDKLTFKHPDYKQRSISIAVLETAEKLFVKGGESVNKTTGTEFVYVDVGHKRYPVGYNLIQAKNNAGL